MAKDIKLLKKLFLKNQKGGGSNSSNSTNTILLIMLIVIIIFFIYIYFNNKMNTINNTNNANNTNNTNNANNNANTNTNNNTQESSVQPNVIINDYNRIQPRIVNTLPILRDYDYRTYNDPLTPPYKRDDYMIPAHIIDPVNFGTYTRGIPTVFKKMGYLTDENAIDDKHKFLNLMGRQKYHNSNQYEYYVVSTDRNENIKFDLGKKYRKELYSGDKVKVHPLNNREYNVHIDKNLDYDYNPYII